MAGFVKKFFLYHKNICLDWPGITRIQQQRWIWIQWTRIRNTGSKVQVLVSKFEGSHHTSDIQRRFPKDTEFMPATSIRTHSRCTRLPSMNRRDTVGNQIETEKMWVSRNQCCGSGMFIPDPGSWFLPIPDPGSRIQKQQQKRGVKKKLLS